MSNSVNELGLDEALVYYKPRVASFINRTVYNSADVDDLTQETLLKISRGWDRFRGDGKISTWIFQIAANVCMDFFRARSSRPPTAGKSSETREISTADDTSKAIEQKEMRDCLFEVMEELPAPYSRIMILHDIEGIKLKDIALNEGETLNNIKVRLHRARKKLRTILENVCVFQRDNNDILLCEPKVTCGHKSTN